MYLDKVKKIEKKSKQNIKRQLYKCLSYEGITDFGEIYNKIKLDKRLPDYLKKNEYYETYENLLFGIDISYDEKITIDNVLDDLQESIADLFDETKYLEMYKYNSNVKSIQVANYRQYYISLIEGATKEVKHKYLEMLNDEISKIDIKSYTISILLKKIKLIKSDINLIKDALSYINKNYRDFSKTNLKIYLDSIQKRYQLNSLYDNIMAKKSNLVYKLMAKTKINEETRQLYEFANKKEIKEKLQNEIIDYIFTDEEELKQELINSLK